MVTYTQAGKGSLLAPHLFFKFV